MPDIKTAPTISVVVPFHNEELNVVELYGRLQGARTLLKEWSSLREIGSQAPDFGTCVPLPVSGRTSQYKQGGNAHVLWATITNTDGDRLPQICWRAN